MSAVLPQIESLAKRVSELDSGRCGSPRASVLNNKGRPSEVPLSGLEEELARAEDAYRLMLVADVCLKSGADALLLRLGFSEHHIFELRARAGDRGGYPRYAIRNIKRTIKNLRDETQRRAAGGARF